MTSATAPSVIASPSTEVRSRSPSFVFHKCNCCTLLKKNWLLVLWHQTLNCCPASPSSLPPDAALLPPRPPLPAPPINSLELFERFITRNNIVLKAVFYSSKKESFMQNKLNRREEIDNYVTEAAATRCPCQWQ